MKNTSSLLLLTLFILLGSCSSEKAAEPTPRPTTNDPTAIIDAVGLTDDEEIFTIDSQKDIQVTTENDIKIIIPKQSFVDHNGNPIEGDVELVVRDFVQLSELFTEPISTVSPEGMLATRGMLNIKALHDGKEVQLQAGKAIDFVFPGAVENYAGAELYYGYEADNGNIEWRKAAQQSKKGNDELPKIVVKPGLNFLIREDAQYDRIAPNSSFFQQEEITADSLREWIQLTDDEQQLLSNNSAIVYWTLFSDGDLEVYHVSGKLPSVLKQKLAQKLNSLPIIAPYIRENNPADVSGQLIIGKGNLVEQSIKDKTERIKRRELERIKRNETSNTMRDFSMRSYQLGWINCDIFWRIEKPLIDMQVEKPVANAVMRLVFNNYRTVINGRNITAGKIDFSAIPAGETVKVVAVYPADGQVKISITTTTVTDSLQELAPFTTIAKNELPALLDGLLKTPGSSPN